MELDRKTLMRAVVYLWFTAFLINISLHIPSFYRTQFRGDENVYRLLSRTMGWDLSNYSTAKNPVISKWPNTIYRQPVFHHGPLLPYIMKFGGIFGKSTSAALIFEILTMAIFFLHLLVLYRRLSIPPGWQILGSFAVALGPLLLFSTTRIHTDALTGIYIACAIISFIEALETRSTTWSIWSGIMFAAALNLRLTAIVSLPLIVFCQIIYLSAMQYKKVGLAPGEWSFRRDTLKFEYWKVITIVSLIIVTVGLEHFYRLFATYGSIFPWDFMQSDQTSSWVQFAQTRTRGKNFANLLLLIPLFTVFFLPQTWRTMCNGLMRGAWGAIYYFFPLSVTGIICLFLYGNAFLCGGHPYVLLLPSLDYGAG